MYLYEMTNAVRELYELLETGEIDEQIFNDTIDNLGAEDKLEGYCKVDRQLEAEIEMLKAEEDRLAKKRKAIENNRARLKNAMLDFMGAKNSTKENAGVFTVSVSESKACNIVNESAIPSQYLVPQNPKINKAEILKELKEGKTVDGAELQINRNIRIK